VSAAAGARFDGKVIAASAAKSGAEHHVDMKHEHTGASNQGDAGVIRR
jgi:hypothetical protein